MKKAILSLIVGLFISLNGFAQLADGSIAPDFTATDINGVSHSLYADYLELGKPVIIDVSATWCGPCWSFHNTHALKDLYLVYGPAGSGEIGVLFIEGDASTGQSDLEGNGNTQGNWIAGTPYPIIDNAAAANILETPYYPVVYGVCPDGKIYEFGTGSPNTLKNQIISKCGISPTGAQNNVSLSNNSFNLCVSGQNVIPSVEVTNHGSNTITSIDLNLYSGESMIPVETIEWVGSLSSMSSTNIEFSELINVESSQMFTAVAENANEVSDEYAFNAINSSSVNINISNSTDENDIIITIATDNYPGETDWVFQSSDGTVLSSFGPYEGNGTSSGGPDASTTFEYEVTLPNGDDCYELIINDSYGDGLSLGTAAGYGITTSSGVNLISDFTNPGFGYEVIGLFSTVSYTQSWNCVNNACVDPSDGSGDFTTIADCYSQCESTTTYNCNEGSCEEDSDGTGEFVSMSLCQQNCQATPVLTDLKENELINNVDIYPNPVSNNATVEISTTENSKITLDIIDVLGKKISSNVHNLNTGINKLNINTINLENGIYFVQFTSKGKSSTHKITVAK
jgi:hypothetical protein